MPARRDSFFRQRPSVANAACGFCAGSVFAAVILVFYGLVGWPLLVLAAGAILAGALLPNLGRRGFVTDDEGLTELYWLRSPRRHPWESVQSVKLWLRTAVIDTDNGRIVLDERLADWRRLAAVVMERIAPPEESPEAEEIPPERVCQWLGVPADGALVCRQRVFVVARLGMGCLVTWIATLLASSLLGVLALGPIAGVAAALAVDWLRGRRAPSIRADGFGLTVRDADGKRFVPWSAVQQLVLESPEQRRFYWTPEQMAQDHLCQIGTRFGVYRFYRSDWGGEALLAGLTSLLEARAAGSKLPDLGQATDASLSRPRLTGDEAADRGLSRPVAEAEPPNSAAGLDSSLS